MPHSFSPAKVSITPEGVVYEIPTEANRTNEIESLRNWIRESGRPVVVVQGVGFVGAAMAVAIALGKDDVGRPRYNVLGVERPIPSSYWKCCRANEGVPPYETVDKELINSHKLAVKTNGNLRFTWVEEAYELAEIIVVDINLDVTKNADQTYKVEMAGFEQGIRTIGKHMSKDTLVIVGSTVPPGTCSKVVQPILTEELQRRGLMDKEFIPAIAHSYERVMPGPNYLGSIIRFWRVYSGNSESSANRAEKFLSNIIDVKSFPLTRLQNTASSEIAKVLENSYRTANIAFIHDWTLLAEQAGVDLFAVVEAIRLRKGTHDNIRYPGFGVGGYCLTKDSLLADWAAREYFGLQEGLPIARNAIRINDNMPAHTFAHLCRLLSPLHGKKVLILGVSYLAGVADTRATPTGLLVDLIRGQGGEVILVDPLVRRWEERPAEVILPTPYSNLEKVDAVVFALPHDEFKILNPGDLIEHLGGPLPIVDAQKVIPDESLSIYKALGCSLSAVGRGNIL